MFHHETLKYSNCIYLESDINKILKLTALIIKIYINNKTDDFYNLILFIFYQFSVVSEFVLCHFQNKKGHNCCIREIV